MRTEFVVRVTPLDAVRSDDPSPGDSPATLEFRLAKLPIVIGRTAGSDVQIVHAFVSSTHARIEDVGGKLYVRDLDSRNGVQVRSGATNTRIPAQTPHELARVGNEFLLGSTVRVHVETLAFGTSRELSGIGDGLPPLPNFGRPLPDLPSLGLPSRAADFGDALSLPPVPHDAGGRQRGHPPSSPRGFEPVRAGRAHQPDPVELGPHSSLRTGNFELSSEALALQGLREIVASLTPGRKLNTRGDVGRLITKLHSTLEVMCRSFISLRDGYSKFVGSLQLERSAHYSGAKVGLALAQEPKAVAAQLLDFREGAKDAGPELEAALHELSQHQVALLDGFMHGVRALLEELAPEKIESHVEHRRGALRMKRADREVWEEYCARYEKFASEGEAFARVFGAEFAEAYRHYRRTHTR